MNISRFFKFCLTIFLLTCFMLPPSFGEEVKKEQENTTTKTGKWDHILKNWKPFGDFRIRLENDNNIAHPAVPPRYRARYRFRLGSLFKINDEFTVGLRLVSGTQTDQNSPHQTYGNVARKNPVSIDQAFLSYKPKKIKGLWAIFGKFAHPFLKRPIYSELIWDGDVQPEGMAFGYKKKYKNMLRELDFTMGTYLLSESAGGAGLGGNDPWGLVTQIAGILAPSKTVEAKVAMAYYWYSGLTPSGNGAVLTDNAGNATFDANGDGKADGFKSNFGILNLMAAGTFKGKMPITISSEFIVNTRANSKTGSFGWSFGVSVGEIQKKGDFQFYYLWSVVQQDAVLSVLAEDDLIFQTNNRTHTLGIKYAFVKDFGIHFRAFLSRRDSITAIGQNDRDNLRLRVDFNLKF